MMSQSSTSISGAIFLIHKEDFLPSYYEFETQPSGVVNPPSILHNRTLTTFEGGGNFLLVDIVWVLYNIFS